MADVYRWRVLRRLLPKWYRTRFGEELWDMHERRAGGKRGLAFWLRLTLDVLLTSVQSRLDRPVLPANDLTGGASTMDSVLQDIRYAFRALRHRKRMTVLALLTFGIGIGSSTAMSSVLNAVLLRSLPFAGLERIVSI